jgi:hypothetical protein
MKIAFADTTFYSVKMELTSFTSKIVFSIVGTGRRNEYPCPLGTYSVVAGLNASEECTPCAGGHYCGVVGQVAPTGLCAAGYFCKRFAKTSTPNQTDDASICPRGKLNTV